jgi:ACS family glucarate transporter-like MFS transporter
LKQLNSKQLLTIFLCFCSNLLCFLNRVNISIAAPFIMQAFGWNETQMGIIFSAFFAGYVLFMIPGGVVADRYGAYKVLAAGAIFHSLFTFITPFFSQIGSVFLCRYMVGTGQGVNFPSITHLIARHVSLANRVKAQGFTLSGVTLGVVIGFPVGSWIIQIWGWPTIFYVFGLVGFIWSFLWLVLAPKNPGKDLVSSGSKDNPIPWKRLLTHRSALGLTFSYFCHNYSGYLFLVWLPTYLLRVHGFSITAMGIGAAMPALASGICMNVSGWFSDYMVKKGQSQEFSRKLMLYSGMGFSGLFLLSVIWAQNAYLAVFLITLSAAARALSTPVYWALSVDMAPNHAGILSSIMNTSGNVAGVVASILTGWMISYFSGWDQAILMAAVINLCGVGIAVPTIKTSEIV